MSEILLSKSEEARYDELCLLALDFARHNETTELEKMIKAGLNVNLKSAKGDTLLMLASYNNALECVKMLLRNGAKVDERNDRGQTPLMGAAFKGHLNVVKELINAGADINADNGLGANAYNFALIFGRFKTAKYLLKMSKKPTLWQKFSLNLAGIFANIFTKFRAKLA